MYFRTTSSTSLSLLSRSRVRCKMYNVRVREKEGERLVELGNQNRDVNTKKSSLRMFILPLSALCLVLRRERLRVK